MDCMGVTLVMHRNEQGIEKIVVPSTRGLKQLLMLELHEIVVAGLLGACKLVKALFQCVWWPKLCHSASKFVANCPVCQHTKDATTKPPGLL